MKNAKSFVSQLAIVAGLAFSINAPASADQVFNDDLIVTFSACIGNDCVNGESFGFDTMRLKENNLRIHFDDTSTSASFPSNDWRLVANDSANGGGNYFAIEDSTAGRIPFRVEAGAPANSLYVEDAGRVGFGTSTPVVEMHVVDGDTPTLRLEQDGSSGFTPQTFDVAANEANFFVRDVTNGSRLSFRIRPGAPESSIDIASSGNVGMGTSSPDGQLHVRETTSSFDPTLTIEDTNTASKALLLLELANAPRIRFDNTAQNAGPEWDLGMSTSGGFLLRDRVGNANVMTIDTSGNMVLTGAITTAGGTCGGGCDFVFDEDYDLMPISEHAERMWSAGYLPNVGPTIENEPINLSDKVGRMLNELETAHIYIAQLNERIEALESERN